MDSDHQLTIDIEDPKKTFVSVRPITGLSQSLTYAIPNSINNVQIGSLVKIPLRKRALLGVVDSLNPIIDFPTSKIKPIQELIHDAPIMTPELLKLAHWILAYYAASPESLYQSMIPAPLRSGAKHKLITLLKIAHPLKDSELQDLKKRAPAQAAIYEEILRIGKETPRKPILEKVQTAKSTADAMVKKGILVERKILDSRDAYHDPLSTIENLATRQVTLNPEQRDAVDSINSSIDSGNYKTHLLHGVTGSGKTEVFLGAMEHAVQSGGSALFLVPEVALTPQTVARIRARFTPLGIKTVVWHSMLSDGERLDAWMSVARGEAKVVVGARSAIFAPLQNLKLLIVDEEHEPAYKQGESPRYHGRDVSIYRAHLNKATCVLGSATPSLESLYNVEHKGYVLNKLTTRVDKSELPKVHVVDMKPELIKSKKPSPISQKLADLLIDRFEKKEQSILFLNRRGYSAKLLCPECDYIAECPHCSVTLTHHRTDDKLRCHICSFQQNAPPNCPSCNSDKIRGQGTGTQRVEDVVAKILPKANIVRMDADTMSRKNRFREILADFRKGKIDILVGTQMIAKGLDFPNVTLVGLIDADLSLHIQDFRASERTFQLVVQVAGRAGRGDRAGEVVIQSFAPHSAPIQFARRADFDGFLESELAQRKEFNYPPYRHIIRHIFRGRDPESVQLFAEKWTTHLEKNIKHPLEIRGPAPAPLEKIKDFYRFHTWIFTNNVSKVLPDIMKLRADFPSDERVIDVLDVDPIDSS